jgi:glutaredoxin-like protein NrdH
VAFRSGPRTVKIGIFKRRKKLREGEQQHTSSPKYSQHKEQIMTVTVYTKPSCVQCNATYRALDSKGIEYNIIDLSEDAAALDTVKELGYMQAPVVIAGDEHWSGFRPDKVSQLAQQLNGN